jgi:hypothetical protein
VIPPVDMERKPSCNRYSLFQIREGNLKLEEVVMVHSWPQRYHRVSSRVSKASPFAKVQSTCSDLFVAFGPRFCACLPLSRYTAQHRRGFPVPCYPAQHREGLETSVVLLPHPVQWDIGLTSLCR